MDNFKAFSLGERNRDREQMVFDWDKAAALIKERKPDKAGAGLQGDWEWTGGTIFENGKIVSDDYTYLASTWAVPELNLDGKFFPCYKMKSEVGDWDCHTKWPKSAVVILNG